MASLYPALVDGEEGAYGVTFRADLPGIVATRITGDASLLNAEEALRDYAIESDEDGEDDLASA